MSLIRIRTSPPLWVLRIASAMQAQKLPLNQSTSQYFSIAWCVGVNLNP